MQVSVVSSSVRRLRMGCRVAGMPRWRYHGNWMERELFGTGTSCPAAVPTLLCTSNLSKQQCLLPSIIIRNEIQNLH